MEKSDYELVEGIKSGNEGDFEELYLRYRGIIHSALTRIVSIEDAEEIADDVFVRARQKINKYQSGSDSDVIFPWLLFIGKNLALSRLRLRRGIKSRYCEEYNEEIHSSLHYNQKNPRQVLELEELEKRVLDAIDQLSPTEKEGARFYFENGICGKGKYGVPIKDSIKMRWKRAKDKLAIALDEI